MQHNNDPIPQAELLVRLATLAAELGTTVDELAAKLKPDAVSVDSVGFRCCEADVARQLLDEHLARQAAHSRRRAAQHARREQFKAKHQASVDALRARLQARAERDRELLSADPSLDAYALARGGDFADHLDRKGRMLDALFAGRSEGYRISPLPD